jgi:hypothetical protein
MSRETICYLDALGAINQRHRGDRADNQRHDK